MTGYSLKQRETFVFLIIDSSQYPQGVGGGCPGVSPGSQAVLLAPVSLKVSLPLQYTASFLFLTADYPRVRSIHREGSSEVRSCAPLLTWNSRRGESQMLTLVQSAKFWGMGLQRAYYGYWDPFGDHGNLDRSSQRNHYPFQYLCPANFLTTGRKRQQKSIKRNTISYGVEGLGCWEPTPPAASFRRIFKSSSTTDHKVCSHHGEHITRVTWTLETWPD